MRAAWLIRRRGIGVPAVVAAACLLSAMGLPGAQASSSPVGSAGLVRPPQTLIHGAQPRTATGPNYPGALWEPASRSNYTVADRPDDLPIQRIVIHVAEGGFASTYRWFQDPAAQASAHYLVSRTGQVAQMVPESDIAWHAGNWAYNETSIGIEHAGYTALGDFTQAEYLASAHLSAYLVRKYTIVPDRARIIGHYQVPDPFHPGEYGGADHHTDPGPYWNWGLYMGFIRLYANVTYERTVDDSTPGAFLPAPGWLTSNVRRGYVGSGYHYAVPSTTAADPVTYRLPTVDTADYDVFMRWPCNSSYNRRVTVGLAIDGGYRATHVDEASNCDRWNYLGTYPFAGDGRGRLVVLRSSPDPGNIAADAVRIVETTDPHPPSSIPSSGLQATTTRTTATLDWPAATDNIRVAGYRLWKDGSGAGLSATTSDTLTGLRCDWGYTVWVRAYDGFWNLSPEAAAVTVLTAPCPAAPTNVTATAGTPPGGATLTWTASPDASAGYAIFIDGAWAASVPAGTTSYAVASLDCAVPHTLAVQARATDGTVSGEASTSLPATC